MNEKKKESPDNDEVEILNRKKQELELRKLECELSVLKKQVKWFKNPTYLGIIFQTTIAIAGLLWAITSGLFDKKYDQHQLDKKILELDIREFKEQRKSIEYQLIKATVLKQELTKKTESLKKELTILNRTNDSIKMEFQKVRVEKLVLEKQFNQTKIENQVIKEKAEEEQKDLKKQIQNSKMTFAIIQHAIKGGLMNVEPFYDGKGNLTETIINGRRTRYIYNSDQNLISIIDSTYGITNFGYLQDGRLKFVHYPNGNQKFFHYNKDGLWINKTH